MPTPRHKDLLKNKAVSDWCKELALGSEATAANYLRMIGKFLTENHLTPNAFLKLPGKDQAALLRTYVWRDRDNLGARPGAAVVKKAIVSWLKFNDVSVENVQNVSVKGAHITRSTQRLPTKDDLRRVLNIADAKTRVAVSLIAFSGQRPEVIGNLKGADGLRFNDLPDARFDAKGQLAFNTIPARIDIRAVLSKTRKAFFTFIGPEGCAYLQAYIAERVAQGEKVTGESPVFTLDPRQRRTYGKAFMCTPNVTDRIKAAMQAVGLSQRPYIWRSYFSQNTAKAIAEGLPTEWREYWEGHTQGVQEIYALRDPTQLTEEMRKGYDKARKYLETLTIDPRGLAREALTMLADSDAHAPAEPMRAVTGSSDEELVEYIQKTFAPVVQSPLTSRWNGVVQKTIAEAELDAALAEGWAVKLQLRDGRLVVEKPIP